MFAILISTKNRKADLIFTLLQLGKLLQRNDVVCTVYDDGSTDGTFEAIAENFPHIQLMRNETSKGYLYCRNKMLNETADEFAISLDDDAHFLSENPLEEIQKHFDDNSNCALIAFRLFWNTNPPQNITTVEIPESVKSFVGCGHVWRMKAWRDIPNYPEWFEFYGEEDFASLQLFKKVWEVHYVPQVLVQHRVDLKLRTQQNRDFGFRYRRSLRAGWYSYLLFYPISKIPRLFGYSLSMQFRKIFKGNSKVIVPLFEALADMLIHFPHIVKNRNALTPSEYENYRKLKETKTFWTPEK
jgi:GT2 family glycosyltransferase